MGVCPVVGHPHLSKPSKFCFLCGIYWNLGVSWTVIAFYFKQEGERIYASSRTLTTNHEPADYAQAAIEVKNDVLAALAGDDRK